jgi:hypothetical protein
MKNLEQTIRRILKEETQNIGEFMDTLKFKYDMSDELTTFIENFIDKSNCPRISFVNFKMQAFGASLLNGVLINKLVLNQKLEFMLYVIFHEIAHQYQYKKYGREKMIEFYKDEISSDEAAKFMKNVELVADNFAARKIRELQKMGVVNPNYITPSVYENYPIQAIQKFIDSIRKELRIKNIRDIDDITEFLYNTIKSEIQ